LRDSIEYIPAAALSLEALADLFTRSFEGYFYPAEMSAADLAWRIRIEAIDLWRSAVLRVGGEPAGLALLAVRADAAWCGGFGIMAGRRGQGLAQGLAEEMVSRAREAGVRRLRLEVLTRNERAARVYERAGLQTVRDLLVLGWQRPDGAPASETPALAEHEPRALLRHFEALHPHEPAWQRDLPSLLGRWPIDGYALGDPASPEAYSLLRPAADGAALLADLGAGEEGAAGRLIAGLQARFPRITSVNEPAGSPQAEALLAAGFSEVDRQHEMELRF
jgi:GNAT superfamily N-acetyltransferase